MTQRLTGIVTPLLTPYADDLSIAHDLYVAHATTCLEAGSHYLSPFGTTGEAVSNSPAERMDVLERLVAAGIGADRLMPGTGLCSLGETVALTRHAAALGCTAAMVLPPFFYPADEEALYRHYSLLVEAMGGDAVPLILYNIPQNSGVKISPALAARLNRAFPEVVTAYKDSSGDWDNTVAVIRAVPGIAVFPGSETLMAKGMALGAAGCISASCNTNTRAIRAAYDVLASGGAADDLQPGLEAYRVALQEAGLIPGLKSLMAHRSRDARWLNLRPPLAPADPSAGAALAATVG